MYDEELTIALALDCEMVGIGPDGEKSILAQVSVGKQGKGAECPEREPKVNPPRERHLRVSDPIHS